MPDRPNDDLPARERTPVQELRDWEVIQDNEDDRTERLVITEGALYRSTGPSGVAMVFVPRST